MEETIFLNSLKQDEYEPRVQRKYFVEIFDDNNFQYSQGAIKFNTVTLQSVAHPISFSESMIQIPYAIDIESDVSINMASNSFIATLKNSFLDIISSINVKLNGVSVVNDFNLTNLLLTFKLLAETAENNKIVENLAFYKNTGIMRYNTVASPYGVGESMNSILDVVLPMSSSTNPGIKESSSGLFNRMAKLNVDPLEASYSEFTTENNMQVSRKSYVKETGVGANVDKKKTLYYFVEIPLDCFDFFKKCPLMRGPKIEILLKAHSSKCTMVTTDFTAPIDTVTLGTNHAVGPFSVIRTTAEVPVTTILTSVSSMYEYTPFIVASGHDLKLLPASSPLTITSRIAAGDSAFSGMKCILRCCMYQITEEFTSQYFDSFSGACKINYEQCFYNQFKDIATTGLVTKLITTNTAKIIGLLVQTVVAASRNGTAGYKFSTCESPFTPTLNAKCASWSNVNLRWGPTKIYETELNYTYEQYKLMSDKFMINGGANRELTSGLISRSDFDNGYGYMYFDLSHLKSSAEWSMSRSLEFIGNLNMKAGTMVDIHTFLIYEDSIAFDPRTSQIILKD